MITLCTPSRGRPAGFANMVASARATADEAFEVVGWLDQDDPQRGRYPQAPDIIYGSGPRPYVNGVLCMSGLWTEAWKIGSGDIAMMCADDSKFRTPHWDTMVEEAFASVPDEIVMVYGNHNNAEDMKRKSRTSGSEPFNPFVSRKWMDVVGYFAPYDYPGWGSDCWTWALAAEIERSIYVPQLIIEHMRVRGSDDTYTDGENARRLVGGWEGLSAKFYSPSAIAQRDREAELLRGAMTGARSLVPKPEPVWLRTTLDKQHAERNPDTLVVAHCYAGGGTNEPGITKPDDVGDDSRVRRALPQLLHHTGRLLVLSPEDAPVEIDHPGVECRSAGPRAYVGPKSLDRQRAHLKLLLDYPHKYFLLNDADSLCLSPKIPAYLYEPEAEDAIWSNLVRDSIHERMRTSDYEYPHLALQPPYFMSRAVLERMVAAAEQVEVDPLTPFIDWYMLALAHKAGVRYERFHGCVSHQTENDKGLGLVVDHVYERGAVMVHSIKRPEALVAVVAAYNGSPYNPVASRTRSRIIFPHRSYHPRCNARLPDYVRSNGEYLRCAEESGHNGQHVADLGRARWK